MLIKRRQHRVPVLNTTATADISFMLLTFFLVTTSMDVDRGLVRQLPPLDNEQEQNAEVVEVERENTMAFAIDANGKLTLDAKPVNMSQVGKRGEHHVISIDTDPAADYNTYFALEDAIVGAYADARDRIARKKYRTGYAQLSEAERQKVRKACPQHILETYRTSADAATTTAPAGADGTMQKGGKP